MAEESEPSARVLFCPFCREAFEGETECPEHELALVDFQRLPKQAHERAMPGMDEAVGILEWRLGRAEIAAGAVLLLGAFCVAPLATAYFDLAEPVEWTGLAMAMGPARSLWTAPLAAVLLLAFLFRRRTPREMRGARLAGLLLSMMPAVSLAYALTNVWRGAEQAHGGLRLEISWGLWPMLLGCVALAIGSIRFGVLPAQAPHGSEPDEPPRIEPRKKKRKKRS